MNNSNLIGTVSRQLAINSIRNNNIAVPTSRVDNSVFNYAATPLVTQKGFNQAHVYGFNTQDQDFRISNTLNQLIEPDQKQLKPIYQQSKALNALMEPNEPTPQKETYAPPATYSDNTVQKLDQSYLSEPILSQSQLAPSTNFIAINSDSIVINRSVVVVLIGLAIAVFVLQLWFRQKKLELMLIKKQYNTAKSIESRAALEDVF